MNPIRLFAATGDAVAELVIRDGIAVEPSFNLEGRGVMSVAVDPHDPERVFAGTFDRGIYRTLDGGDSWSKLPMEFGEVRALAWVPSG